MELNKTRLNAAEIELPKQKKRWTRITGYVVGRIHCDYKDCYAGSFWTFDNGWVFACEKHLLGMILEGMDD